MVGGVWHSSYKGVGLRWGTKDWCGIRVLRGSGAGSMSKSSGEKFLPYHTEL